jgi:hypothetical protein
MQGDLQHLFGIFLSLVAESFKRIVSVQLLAVLRNALFIKHKNKYHNQGYSRSQGMYKHLVNQTRSIHKTDLL